MLFLSFNTPHSLIPVLVHKQKHMSRVKQSKGVHPADAVLINSDVDTWSDWETMD